LQDIRIERLGVELMKMLDLLNKELIVTKLEVETKEELFEKLYKKLYDSGFVKESYLDGIKKREEKFPTGLQLNKYGAAIPHTDPKHVITPAIVVATLAKPLSFKNMENSSKNVDVNVVFMMALKDPHSQIDMLKQLASLLQNDSILEKILNAETSDEIMEIIKNVPLS
jgi:PTS system galactitol-specific IIA component